MTWQPEVGSGTKRATTKRDLVTKIVALATSQHVATVAVNAGGTGWTTGDVATLSHASGFLDARFSVTASAGAITGLTILASGAFSIRATSATVGTAGNGYNVGDILEVQGGTQREGAKFQVATLTGGAGSGVATVTLFETGGAYTATPSNDAATVGIGPAAFAGDDACELTVTYGSLIGTTGLSVTGPGSAATVDITLAETGWTVDGRNTNSFTQNSITDEKTVVMVGDAAGHTNKPYIGLITGTSTSGIDTRHFVGLYGMIAHNPATAFDAQPGLSPGTPTTGGFGNDEAYILCDENEDQQMDFWLSVSDKRICGVININSAAANTDDGEYMQFYLGFNNRLGTETQDPYPMVIAGSARSQTIDPSTTQFNITGLAECFAPSSPFKSPIYYYREEDASWQNVINGRDGQSASFAGTHIMAPFGRTTDLTVTANLNYTPTAAPNFSGGAIRHDRTSPTRRIMPVPGTAAEQALFPLTIIGRPGGVNIDTTNDTVRGDLEGVFFIYNTDSAGATISNFSEDIMTVGSLRYFVFHNHTHTEPYQYIALLEDV